MKYLLLFVISGFSFKCFAQRDTTEIKHSHRLWFNPTQIITGQYTVAYGLRFYKNNWIEVGGGYKYIPTSIVRELPIAPQKFFEILADPEHGLGFTGPVAMVSFIHYHEGKTFDGVSFELFYQHLSHPPDCYYEPDEYHDHNTHSSVKDNYGLKVLAIKTLGASNHFISQLYFGGGLRLYYGELTTYYTPKMYPGATQCVVDIHDPDVSTSQALFSNLWPSFNFGIRLGLQ